MKYGAKEFAYAEPFASALDKNERFRRWVLQQTKFAGSADDARLLSKEMMVLRGAGTKHWWRSHYTESCRCFGCCGQETDLLAIFEARRDLRFALHIEVKQPRDRFPKSGRQAAAYPIRAQCWATPGRTPPRVLKHSAATTMLLCSEVKLPEYSAHLRHFDSVVTFENVEKHFPSLLPKNNDM